MLKHGRMKADDVLASARIQGIAPKTLYRVKRDLKVDSIRQGFGAKGVWFWDLPLVSKNPARQTVVNYGDVVARHQAKAVVRRRAKP